MKVVWIIQIFFLKFCACNFNLNNLPISIGKIFKDFTSSLVAPDALVRTPDLIEAYGYPVEKHEVRTEDRYVLELHRIPYGLTNNSNAQTSKPVVFLMHSILWSSADYIYTGPNRSLALYLADAGYDVWLGNSRGTTYSSKHLLWKRSDPRYWQFSYHEIGYYDLAASIDYILQLTDRQVLYYVGYGQGCTSLYVLLSCRPQYNRKIKLGINMAISTYFNNMRSKFLKFFGKPFFVYPIMSLTIQFGFFSLHINNFLLAMIGKYFCGEKSLTKYICASVLFSLTGENLKNFDFKLLPIILGHTPEPISVKQLIHYGQGIAYKRFTYFDYGYTTNYVVYGQTDPPKYDLENITAPLVLYSAENDFISTPEDTEILARQLGTRPTHIIVQDKKFNHIDFMWGLNAPEILYSEIIQLIQNN